MGPDPTHNYTTRFENPRCVTPKMAWQKGEPPWRVVPPSTTGAGPDNVRPPQGSDNVTAVAARRRRGGVNEKKERRNEGDKDP